jgi:putative ATP-dependent endonuclease of OLD family
MLKNKTDAAFELLQRRGEKLAVPSYIGEAITWIRN